MSAPENPVPFDGVVDSLRPLPDGRVRVTFTRFASPYYVPAAGGEREALLTALGRSQSTGAPVSLAWRLENKELVLRAP